MFTTGKSTIVCFKSTLFTPLVMVLYKIGYTPIPVHPIHPYIGTVQPTRLKNFVGALAHHSPPHP